MLAGLATVNFAEDPEKEFDGFWGACSTYGSFSYLKYGAFRLLSQLAQDCDWKVGSPWKMVHPDGRVTDAGKVLEFEPYSRYVLEWGNEFMPELKAEGVGRMTCTLESVADAVKLTILHEMPVPDSKTIAAVSGGWPKILSSLKSLLETGSPMPDLKTAVPVKVTAG